MEPTTIFTSPSSIWKAVYRSVKQYQVPNEWVLIITDKLTYEDHWILSCSSQAPSKLAWEKSASLASKWNQICQKYQIASHSVIPATVKEDRVHLLLEGSNQLGLWQKIQQLLVMEQLFSICTSILSTTQRYFLMLLHGMAMPSLANLFSMDLWENVPGKVQ